MTQILGNYALKGFDAYKMAFSMNIVKLRF